MSTNPAETFNRVREKLVGRHGPLHLWFVLLGFLHRGQGRSYCFPGQRTLADRVGCDAKSVRPWLDELARKSLIVEESYDADKHDHCLPGLYSGRAIYTLLGERGEPYYGPETGPPWWSNPKTADASKKDAATPPQSRRLHKKGQSGKTVGENHHTAPPKTTAPKTNNRVRGKTTAEPRQKPPQTVVPRGCGGSPQRKYMQSEKEKKGRGSAFAGSGTAVLPLRFDPLPEKGFLREWKELASRAKAQIKKIIGVEENYERILAKDVADLVTFLETEAKQGKGAAEKLARVKQLKANAGNYVRGDLKPQPAADVKAWRERLAEIEARMDGVRR